MKLKAVSLNRLVIFCHDAFMICLAWSGAYWLRFNLGAIPATSIRSAEGLLPLVFCLQIACFYYFGLYRGVWRFASIPDLIRIVKAVFLGTLIALGSIFVLTHLQGVPRSVFPLYAILLTTFLSGSRVIYRRLRELQQLPLAEKRVLIVGAGIAGEGLARDLLRDNALNYQPILFVDDDPRKKGQELHGIRVLGTSDEIPALCKKHKIDLIFLALPSVSSRIMRSLVEICEKTELPLRTLPGLKDLADGRVNINALRDVSIEDLLGRDQVSLDWENIKAGIDGMTVLVTGGGGSIGSELCRQIAKLTPKRLIIIENCEYNLYAITQELERDYPHLKLEIQLISVVDKVAIENLMKKARPDVIFHAAAYKHVPLLESQLRPAMMNNILGTRVIAEAAVTNQVKRFILISTDKAVNPTNFMGATKRAAEIFCQNLNEQGSTQFITVRFGNVLGSAGSVVPLFKQQLAKGGPLTVTHPDISRYFMTIPEACQLILQAMVLGKEGEIFVLDMGEPIKINYLAEQMIRLSGKEVGKDIRIVYTGLRPGEKLNEELFHARESLRATKHEKILMASHRQFSMRDLLKLFGDIQEACDSYDETKLRQCLKILVPEAQMTKSFHPDEKVLEVSEA